MKKKIFLRTKNAVFEMELNKVGLTFLEYMLPNNVLLDFYKFLREEDI